MSAQPIRHIAIIMDGNNRWAKQKGVPGPSGHKAGVERIRDVMRCCREHEVEVLTLFAFSSENWQRPPREVEALMALFLTYLKRESKRLRKEGVRLRVIGNRARFSERIQRAIREAEDTAADGDRHLVIAADYGGQWDIANAARRLAEQVRAGALEPGDINEDTLQAHIALADLPAPDLLIRTGGELRISNFLLWQSAYTELYFSDLYWPDFDAAALEAAIADFRCRQRRFGLSGEQIEGVANA
ncbi:di-trans,poly-cis-decaprenylcistransferase [Exilibacterium tricleocarpae]|uniref:Ditrans,polycis-undecaprenyl-diphosphate synthase ((2E,6E)-farnesyl-diphosphate specific) n=1 Tax=Exilibacterium tricleocarpae TaxID=2591008 RepID=A0A545U8C5_9GAMM|nr:polyprenyl diphosphate synthase [Exilibacterium tricleocarpae]TQV85653.1 di-trans,poly-cis-decaprenylcistransferase [Exilibacterium tricleocarpae]